MTGLTMVEKILGARATTGRARQTEIISVRPDVVLLNDISGPIAVETLAGMGVEKLRDPDRAVVVLDHFMPARDPASAMANRMMRDFVRDQAISHHFENGIEHTVLAEESLVRPGRVVFGGDSHTCTAGAFNAIGMGFGSTDLAAALALGELWIRVPASIRVILHGRPAPFVTGKDVILSIIARIGADGANDRALEVGGPGLAALNIDERMAVANMAVEAGAETCVFDADDALAAFCQAALHEAAETTHADADARYQSEIPIDLRTLEPIIAAPPSPAGGVGLTALRGVKVDQVYIGNCANGTITDLRQAASILRGRRVHRKVRLIVVPATRKVFAQALREGLIEVLSAAGATIAPSTCGACFGGHMGVLDAGEVALATTNRNFRGRMGHPDSKVYLGNAWVAAAAAIAGEIVDPAQFARGSLDA